ncbi:hypothetical protein BD309DRAFT_967515 [Dichomitus squalens]|nr:hypothetical protein BD309DRAFT_967515 [Dichomitus squalens]
MGSMSHLLCMLVHPRCLEFIFDAAKSAEECDSEEEPLGRPRAHGPLRQHSDVRIAFIRALFLHQLRDYYCDLCITVVARSPCKNTQSIQWVAKSIYWRASTPTLSSPQFAPAFLRFRFGFIYTGTLVLCQTTFDTLRRFRHHAIGDLPRSQHLMTRLQLVLLRR